LLTVFPYLDGISSDDLTDNAISFILSRMSKMRMEAFTQGLGSLATEELVQTRILPLLKDAGEPLASNLRDVLRQAGDKHGKRYFSEASH
jgi:hypothetical protein